MARKFAISDDSSIGIQQEAYTTKGFAKLIGIQSERTVRDWCAQGKIPGAIKIGRAWIIPRSAYAKLFGTAHPPDNVLPFE